MIETVVVHTHGTKTCLASHGVELVMQADVLPSPNYKILEIDDIGCSWQNVGWWELFDIPVGRLIFFACYRRATAASVACRGFTVPTCPLDLPLDSHNHSDMAIQARWDWP